MKKKESGIIPYVAIGVVLIAAFIIWMVWQGSQPGKYDDFSKCLAASGAKMYGAWWCQHCAAQKKSFGNSWKVFDNEGGYVECETPDRVKIEVCLREEITSYPTWVFPDNSRQTGELALQQLALKSGCKLQ